MTGHVRDEYPLTSREDKFLALISSRTSLEN
jgi:hypothetical protein